MVPALEPTIQSLPPWEPTKRVALWAQASQSADSSAGLELSRSGPLGIGRVETWLSHGWRVVSQVHEEEGELSTWHRATQLGIWYPEFSQCYVGLVLWAGEPLVFTGTLWCWDPTRFRGNFYSVYRNKSALSLILKGRKRSEEAQRLTGIWDISKRKEQEYVWYIGVAVHCKDKLLKTDCLHLIPWGSQGRYLLAS